MRYETRGSGAPRGQGAGFGDSAEGGPAAGAATGAIPLVMSFCCCCCTTSFINCLTFCVSALSSMTTSVEVQPRRYIASRRPAPRAQMIKGSRGSREALEGTALGASSSRLRDRVPEGKIALEIFLRGLVSFLQNLDGFGPSGDSAWWSFFRLRRRFAVSSTTNAPIRILILTARGPWVPRATMVQVRCSNQPKPAPRVRSPTRKVLRGHTPLLPGPSAGLTGAPSLYFM